MISRARDSQAMKKINEGGGKICEKEFVKKLVERRQSLEKFRRAITAHSSDREGILFEIGIDKR